jgi:hypothetical protein
MKKLFLRWIRNAGLADIRPLVLLYGGAARVGTIVPGVLAPVLGIMPIYSWVMALRRHFRPFFNGPAPCSASCCRKIDGGSSRRQKPSSRGGITLTERVRRDSETSLDYPPFSNYGKGTMFWRGTGC